MVQLYTHREDVDLVNAHQLAGLPTAAVRFTAQDTGPSMDLLKAACPVSPFLSLLPPVLLFLVLVTITEI